MVVKPPPPWVLNAYVAIIVLFAAGLTVLMSIRFLQMEEFDYGEYYILVLLAAVGMMLILTLMVFVFYHDVRRLFATRQ